jgi:hypothetical protein
VERFDAGPGSELIADNFPTIVAGLPRIDGDALVDPRRGFWQGARFAGTKKIAILRQGKVVGLRRRSDDKKEVVPPEVVRRDPNQDVRDAWVAIDFGARATVVAVGNGERHELVRIGATKAPTVARDFEIPSEVGFINLPRVIKAWSDRVILPLTEWADVKVGFAARDRRAVVGKERAQRTRASVDALPSLSARFAVGTNVYVCGRSNLDAPVKLDAPAAPIIDEEGISPDDPFDPVELFAYYMGLHINCRERGIHLRYAVGMPAGWSPERRTQLMAQIRRGVLRSLPAGMVAYDDLDLLQVIDAGPNVLSFAAFAFKVFGISPKSTEPVPFASVDAGASETAVLCGQYREGSPDEVAGGYEKVIEHVEPTVLPTLGGEQLLHRMAYKVYVASASSMRHNEIPFEVPAGEEVDPEAGDRLDSSFEAQLNVRLLKDAVRPILEKVGPAPLPDLVQLFARDGRVRDVRIMVDRAVLAEWLRGQLSEGAIAIKEAITKGIEQVWRGDIPFEEVRVVLGGRLSMHPFLQERLEALLPQGVKVHKFREPDDTNLAAPTVKLATTLGILMLRYQNLGPAEVNDDRASFNYQVGRAKRGKLLTVLDASVGYDVWRELGACTRPDVQVLYTTTSADDLAADDPTIQRVTCNLGFDAVGYRIYMRATGGDRVELSVGPPGGRPDDDAVVWAVDLGSASAMPMSRR